MFPTPVEDPTGGKLVNPAPDQNKGTALVSPDKSGENGASNTGNIDGKPDTGGNITTTPIPDALSQDDIAYISKIWSDKKIRHQLRMLMGTGPNMELSSLSIKMQNSMLKLRITLSLLPPREL
ncbi:hypothetical protein [Yersinia mollaretii]|uniref:hypothetical protein n=1 Tax=Yersinia mollaretii TaxID=33060 RepID=UPI00067BCDFD|nr:hypothetical protein [Yersinia mollaretii]